MKQAIQWWNNNWKLVDCFLMGVMVAIIGVAVAATVIQLVVLR